MDCPGGIDEDYAAATGAHLSDVDRRYAQLVTRAGVETVADVQASGDLVLVRAIQLTGLDN